MYILLPSNYIFDFFSAVATYYWLVVVAYWKEIRQNNNVGSDIETGYVQFDNSPQDDIEHKLLINESL